MSEDKGRDRGRVAVGGDREVLVGLAALGLAIIALVALWSPRWTPGWASAVVDALAAVYLVALLVLAMRARLDFLRPRGGDHTPTALGSILVGVVFALLLAALASGALYAASAKHGLYQPFLAPPSRLQTLAFFINEAAKGALFDVMDVFGVDAPGAPAYDPKQHWGFGLVVVIYRLAAAFAVWSLIFGYIARRAVRRGGK